VNEMKDMGKEKVLIKWYWRGGENTRSWHQKEAMSRKTLRETGDSM
jgi:hypothetical protein